MTLYVERWTLERKRFYLLIIFQRLRDSFVLGNFKICKQMRNFSLQVSIVECRMIQVPILTNVQVLERLRSQIFDTEEGSEGERSKRGGKVEESQKTRMRRILKKFISDSLQR